MALVNLSDLQEGMVVASPVVVQGNVLLGEGKALTSKVIHILKAWGISGVDVVGEPQVDEESFSSELSSEERDRLRAAVDYRLKSFNPNDEVMTEVKRIMMKREVQKLTVQKGNQ